MKYNPDIHHRHSIRLKNYDYSQTGPYFITICTHQRECLFGEIIDSEVHLNQLGNIVKYHWQKLPKYYSYLQLDEFVIMPNHLHGIMILLDDRKVIGDDSYPVGAGLAEIFVKTKKLSSKPAPTQPAPTKPAPTKTAPTHPAPVQSSPGLINSPKRKGIPEIIRGFKTFSAKQINRVRQCCHIPLWQRTYYDHIIRSEQDFYRIREYILNNPKNWLQDKNRQT